MELTENQKNAITLLRNAKTQEEIEFAIITARETFPENPVELK